MQVRYKATAWYLLVDNNQSGSGTILLDNGSLMFESIYWESYEQYKASNLWEAEKLTFCLY